MKSPTLKYLGIAALVALATPHARAVEKEKPLMRDFMGLNGHTVQFKPELFAKVTQVVRDYHPIDWDFGDDTSYAPQFPMARNKVDWNQVYGSWKKAGHYTHACLIFDNLAVTKWKDMERDGNAYAKAFAAAFGPSSKTPLVGSIEIGNEPGKYDDEAYRKIFEAMAKGAREGDPKMRISTCAMNLGTSGKYSKSVDVLKGLDSLYDIINIHQYAEITGWPTWQRSYAEDPKTKFLEHIGHVLKWRDENEPKKEVWLTEFGWDATSKPNLTKGDFVKWMGNTETEQALWTVRGFLVLAATSLDKAFYYFFNDDDTPHLHASSGLTRNFQPKPAFHAMAQLYRTLGDYRLTKVVRESAEDGYVYEFTHEKDAGKRVLCAWRLEGAPKSAKIPLGEGKVVKAERVQLAAGAAPQVEVRPAGAGAVEVELSDAVVYLAVEK